MSQIESLVGALGPLARAGTAVAATRRADGSGAPLPSWSTTALVLLGALLATAVGYLTVEVAVVGRHHVVVHGDEKVFHRAHG
mgnify:CR=1 FL=1